MDFLRDDVRKLYLRFLFPSMTSAIVTSIYYFVDAIAVGQSEGAVGSAAMAVISPMYGVMAFLAILCGVGGSVLMGVAKGQGDEEKGNACFTVSVVLMAFLTAVLWLVFNLFREQIFTMFGANAEIMGKTVEYGKWIIWFLPVFAFNPFLGAFIRNDGAPHLAMVAVVIGGGINIFGDWFLVFPLKMGMTGAAIASVAGTSVQCVILTSHFVRHSCGLKLVRPHKYLKGFVKILQVGVGAGALDLGAVTIGMMMNNQIRRYGGTTELAVFGVMSTMMALFQAMFSGVGQTVQPIVSSNYGAGKGVRVKTVWHLAFATVVLFGLIFVGIGELFPIPVIHFFMDATPDVLAAAPGIIRLFFLMFLPLGIVVLSAYYLQSVMEEKMSMAIGFLHSIVGSGIMLFFLPSILNIGIYGVWIAMPFEELITAIIGTVYVLRKVNSCLKRSEDE